ncbi:hypothetical protein B5M42_002295 [Paenibacillus athensensis]|uniref:Uncharacterized protein n=1 Tax=Paenibacillus athensensis TaxID=1967502 RepID=A0A4Y8QA98_9BACL|nr:hypothetical protein [Paenibacillus athensensis]MCD1257669.1 hypothetical protein [Paenibacillus athensensis]
MSIRLKLLFSYAAMLVVSLVIMVITPALLIVVFRATITVFASNGQDGRVTVHIRRLLGDGHPKTKFFETVWGGLPAMLSTYSRGKIEKNGNELLRRFGETKETLSIC